ncbi:uncharacterized protein Z518_10047 [Rhinocladiella mackenziei CBS 650.93]|uniref:N-acetyltransferase domain-containing protein n=1 Tax=Rhinocladiella mackenziei CBS 650.93 TaxID=1442369 RepID=A0A0D2ICL7_9EURO|nr:uncharacterized protein Z518_10047 [Rhinocladiella mackenziei CBS 650.93]KIX00981.1 hypothetical protein Z518_10047 [Rhinocladiella mackenziei CBS 650.93]
MPFIRLYQESDKDAMVRIFRETAAPDLRAAGDPVLHYASFLWCRPYLMLTPDSCLVLDDGNGQAVGYLLGAPDTPSFAQKYKDIYIPYLKSAGFEKPGPDEAVGWNENLPNALRQIMYNPDSLQHGEYPQLMENFPAHFHIDILGPYQKQGYGRQLIERFCKMVKEKSPGVKGVHLTMAAANEDAKKFYPRVGFTKFPVVLDGGASGEQGRDQNTIWFVKALP